MTGFDIIEEVEERVILVGVSTGEGDGPDADYSGYFCIQSFYQ